MSLELAQLLLLLEASIKKFQFILVEWEDAAGFSGWRDLSDAKIYKPLLCRTAGWIIHKEKGFITVAGSLGISEKTGADFTVIPTGMVIQIKQLKEPK